MLNNPLLFKLFNASRLKLRVQCLRVQSWRVQCFAFNAKAFKVVQCCPLSLCPFGCWLLAVGYWHYIVQRLFKAEAFNALRSMLRVQSCAFNALRANCSMLAGSILNYLELS